MKVLVILPLLSLFSMGLGCFLPRFIILPALPTEAMAVTTTTTTTTTTTPQPIVTRQATSTNSCTGAEGATFLRTITLNQNRGGRGAIATANAVFTGTGTQTVLCYVVTDRNNPQNQSTFAKTAGAFGTNTVTITATSPPNQNIDADVHFFGTL